MLNIILFIKKKAGEDYDPFNGDLLLEAGRARKCFAIVINEDDVSEEDEFFEVFIANSSISTRVTILENG